MKEQKYCSRCGYLLELVSTNRYNTFTGELIMRGVCPTKICEHDGVGHDYKCRGWFRHGEECTKCGDIVVYPDF